MADKNSTTPPASPNKRQRISAGTAERMQPSKKPKFDAKPKPKSGFLLLITKGGTRYQHLDEEEYQRLMVDMATSLLREPRPVNGYPHIDWHSQTACRSLMACDDERSVTWIKSYAAKLDNGTGAWLSHEGPNMQALQCMVPHPTGKFSPEEILQQIKKTHEFNGNFTILYSKRTEKAGLFIRFAVDEEFLEGLKTVGFKPYCLITRINIFNSRDQARNKERAHAASLKPSEADEDAIMEKKDSEETLRSAGENSFVDPLPPIGSWSDEVEVEEIRQAMQELQGDEVIKPITTVPRAVSCPVPLNASVANDEKASGETIIATVSGNHGGTKTGATKKLPFYRRL